MIVHEGADAVAPLGFGSAKGEIHGAAITARFPGHSPVAMNP
jgi:hypothetical protein